MRPCNGSQAARAYTERLTASPPESETSEIASALVGLHASRDPRRVCHHRGSIQAVSWRHPVGKTVVRMCSINTILLPSHDVFPVRSK